MLALARRRPPLQSRFAPCSCPTDPLAPKEYSLAQDHAFDAFPLELPVVHPVRVAIIDSGIDGGHPEFRSRIWLARSWVGGRADTDEEGHGTFVAGMIAAAINNNEGIAGMAFPAQLIVAKIARSDQSIDVRDEAEAIRWAVDAGARVINLSIGGLRDPFNPERDTFSRVEASGSTTRSAVAPFSSRRSGTPMTHRRRHGRSPAIRRRSPMCSE